MKQHVHFWIGASSSQIQAGAAARHASELKNIVGASEVHRECQGEESELFLSHFIGTGLCFTKGHENVRLFPFYSSEY